MHGYGIAQHLKIVSGDVLQVGESSLYPALQRLLLNGWVKAEWGASESNRKARYYTLTAAGCTTTEQFVNDFGADHAIHQVRRDNVQARASICSCAN